MNDLLVNTQEEYKDNNAFENEDEDEGEGESEQEEEEGGEQEEEEEEGEEVKHDIEWLNDIIEEDLEYKMYYKESIHKINFKYIYLDNNKEIEFIKDDLIHLKDANIIHKNELVSIIKKNNKNNNYTIFSIFLFNIDVEPKDLQKKNINQCISSKVITKNEIYNDIQLNESILFFSGLNEVIIFFIVNNKKNNKNNTKTKTKKIFSLHQSSISS